jgi:uncharacterized protein (TIGR02147 family)
MQRKIRNIYNYIDYRILITDEFMARVSENHSYSLRTYAQELALSPGFLSEVMRGKKCLSLKKGRETFAKLGFQSDELDYAENLIAFKDIEDQGLKRISWSFIEAKYNRAPFQPDESKELLLKSADHFIVHGIVGGFSEATEILAITKRLGISLDRTLEVLTEFVGADYMKLENEQYTLVDINLTLRNHERLIVVQKQFTDLILTMMEKNGGVSAPEKMCHMLVMGFDEDSYALALESHKQLIKSLCRISDQSKKVDRLVFYADSLLTLSPELAKEKLSPPGYSGPEI